MKLHQNPFSSASLKCRAVVHETGVPCEIVDVDFANRKHKSAEFLAMNPNGKVPCLEDDGFFVWESNAICCYLAAKAPAHNLLPSDPKGMALVQQWLQWQATTLGPSVGKIMMEAFYAPRFGRTPNDANLKLGHEETARDLALLEGTLKDGREWITGRLSLADFSLASTLVFRKMIGIDTAAFPHVEQWLARIESRDSMKRALPNF